MIAVLQWWSELVKTQDDDVVYQLKFWKDCVPTSLHLLTDLGS
jgi:hypothetical protein